MTLAIFVIVALSGCDQSLPGGYSVHYGDRGKAWLQNPDGTLAHAGLIKDLYQDKRRLLLIAYPAYIGDELDGPSPIDGTCYVALLYTLQGQQVRQLHVRQAEALGAQMEQVEHYRRPCLKRT